MGDHETDGEGDVLVLGVRKRGRSGSGEEAEKGGGLGQEEKGGGKGGGELVVEEEGEV
jgi:hypothetical protein